MSCTLLTTPHPADNFPPVCVAASLRLIEHYELDYHLAPDPAGDPPQDGEQVAARRWHSYYCAGCRTEFATRDRATAHLVSTDWVVSQDGLNC